MISFFRRRIAKYFVYIPQTFLLSLSNYVRIVGMSYYRVLYIRDGGFLNYEMKEEYLIMGNCAKEMADISCLLSVKLENHLFFNFTLNNTHNADTHFSVLIK